MKPESSHDIQTHFSKLIIRKLERCEASGQMRYQIFRDWAEIVEASLRMLPEHLKSATQTHQMAEDPPDIQELWARMRGRYTDYCWGFFKEAFHLLLESAEAGYADVIGQIYMDFSNPNGGNGQYFTPFPVAEMMARLTVGNVEAEINERLRLACNKALAANDPNSMILQATLMIGCTIPPDCASEYFINRVLPYIISFYEPYTVNDPACGSGIMLLAAAKVMPKWIVKLGLVQFYGQDIDHTCVTMAKINFMLYGLNGIGLQWILALSDLKPGQFAPPLQEKYQEALDHRDDPEAIGIIAAEVRQIQQLELFEVAPSILNVSTETRRRNGRHKNGSTPASIPFQILLPEEISNE